MPPRMPPIGPTVEVMSGTVTRDFHRSYRTGIDDHKNINIGKTVRVMVSKIKELDSLS